MKSTLSRFGVLLGAWLLMVASAASGQPAAWWDEAREPGLAAPLPPLPAGSALFDGDLAEWDQRPHLPLGLLHQSGFDNDWRGRRDLSARVWLADDGRALVLAADVVDDRLTAAPKDNRYLGDHLQVYLLPGQTAHPDTARAVFLLPPRGEGGDVEPAAIVDGDRREPLPGALVAWQSVDGGYRLEARIPWSLIDAGAAPGDVALHLRVVDWDDDRGEKAALMWPAALRPPEKPAEPAQAGGYDPPRLPTPWRPDLFGRLVPVPALDADAIRRFLPALLPLGPERALYQEGETVRVLGLLGVDLPTAARVQLLGVDADGRTVPFGHDDIWSEGAVDGVTWSWRPDPGFDRGLLLAAALADDPGDGPRSYAWLESVGASYREHLTRLESLRERMMAAATAPEADGRRRRYIGGILIQLEDTEQSHGAWQSWMARYNLERLRDDVAEIEADFATVLSGADPYAGRKGTYLRGYVSEIDDTVQHYSVSIPDGWAPGKRMPLIVSLHGYGFGRFHGHPAPAHSDAVAVACYGRGNGDYKLWCERDILTVLDAMIEDYGVDPDRVYCTGGSMGGTGSFHMATLFPDRFAAIGPTASNTNHHVWEEIWGWGQRERTFLTPFRDWLESTTSSFQYAENLRNVGVYSVHGTKDIICPVGHDRTMMGRLKTLGYDAVYEEHPDVGHGGFPYGTGDRQKRFMMSRVRDPYPRHVTYKTSWHRYQGAYWAYIERFSHLARDARIDARVEGQRVHVWTDNVARFRLELAPELLDVEQPIEVIVNEMPSFEGRVPADGVLRLGKSGVRWVPAEVPDHIEKNAQVGGPIEHAFMQRFLLVVGTTGDERANRVNRLMAEQAAEKWRRWGRGMAARIKNDWEVGEQDIVDSNLICYGGPDSNRIVAQVNEWLPIQLDPDNGRVVAGDRVYEGDDVGVKLCYPNPLNPDRYVAVFAGVTWRGTYDINGRFGNWFDWGIFDDRNWFDFTVFDARTHSPETHLLTGYFDQNWKLEHAYLIEGDPALRALQRPRRARDPLADIPSGPTVYLSDLTPERVRMEKGVVGYDHSFGGYPITLGVPVPGAPGGQPMTFERGLGIHPEAELVFDIGGEFRTFECWAGVDLEGAATVSSAREEAEKVAFQVYGDGELLADTGEMRWNTPPRHLVVNVEGVRELKLLARALDGRKWLFGNSSWGLCRLTRAPAAAAAAARPPQGADRLDLAGAWQLVPAPVGRGVARGLEAQPPAEGQATAIAIPGSVPAALMASGELPDLYADDAIRRAASLGDREYWLYRRFDLPSAWAGKRLELRLDGVTQGGDAWLNGQYVGAVSGPFDNGALDVTAAAKPGGVNTLAVRVTAGAAPWTGAGPYKPPAREQTIGYGVGHGLDAGGGLLPLGIVGGAALRATGPVAMAPPRVTPRLPDVVVAPAPEARVDAELTIHTELVHRGDAAVEAVVAGWLVPTAGEDAPLMFERRVALAAGATQAVEWTVPAPGVRLWWPAALGEQPLYRLELQVTLDGELSDGGSAPVGFRQVELAAPGQAAVAVNGYAVPLHVAEWRPADRLLRAEPERTEHLLRLAAAMGFTAVRVWAGGGQQPDEFYDLCDRLGLLVVQDLPLIGDVGRAPLGDVEAAVAGIATDLRNHPAVIAYQAGVDLADNAATRERLTAALREVAAADPAALTVQPLDGGAGAHVWELRAPVDDDYQQQARAVAMAHVVLPTAPPADLGFLDRDALPLDEAVAPWPLTSWWPVRGGREGDLAAAQRWLGPQRGEAAMLAALRWWQAESTRRQMADALAAGGGVYVTALNESWPRVGGALVDHAGQPRPAADVVGAALAGPALGLRLSAHEARPGETVSVEVLAVPPLADRAVRRPLPLPREIRVRVLRPDGSVWLDETRTPEPGRGDTARVGTVPWTVDADAAPGAYLVVADSGDRRWGSETVPLAVAGAPAGERARVLWLADAPLPAGLAAVAPEAFDGAAAEAIYLGARSEPPADALRDAVLAAVRGGAGVVVDGPPAYMAAEAWAPLLAVRPLTGLDDAGPPSAPELVLPDHPALSGLGGLPSGGADMLFDVDLGAEVLAQFGSGRPLLVESSLGGGRVLTVNATRDYQRRLDAWNRRDRLTVGLLAYAAKLPYAATRALLVAPDAAPLASLRDLPEAPLKVSVSTAGLVAAPDQPAVREVLVKNEGTVIVPRVTLALTGLPAGAAAVLSPASFPLMPGEERRAMLTVRLTRPQVADGEATLRVGGWAAEEREVKLPFRAGP